MATDPAKDISLAVVLEDTELTLRRDPGGYYDTGGKWVMGVVADETFRATVQPVSNKNITPLDMPEGVGPDLNFVVWVAHRLLAVDDVILYDGNPYRVMFVWDRLREGGYTKAAIGGVLDTWRTGADARGHGRITRR